MFSGENCLQRFTCLILAYQKDSRRIVGKSFTGHLHPKIHLYNGIL